jgi:high affinity Mn2+ porin
MRVLAVVIVALLGSARAFAQPTPPAPHEDTAFDFMNVVADHGYHDLDDETWNAYGQYTGILNFRLPWFAPYTNTNGAVKSFGTDFETGFTDTFTLFFGVKLWKGGEAYFAPEVIAEHALSNLQGIGGDIPDFELQKNGGTAPTLYRAKLYLRQTFELGGSKSLRTSQPLTLGGTIASRRLVITFGNFTALDIFDKNGVTGDSRQTLLNMAFMTHSSFDFAADARGYSYGVAAELYWDEWIARIGRMLPPVLPNVLPVVVQPLTFYNDSLEIEHDHTIAGMPGAVRLLGYRNRVLSGAFADAIAAFQANPAMNAGDCPAGGYNYMSGDFNAPDLCWVRKPNTKLGVGIDIEQFVAKGIGVFARAMYSDGNTEVDAFNSADRDLSIGAVGKGVLWHRPFDVAGVGLGFSWISAIHAQYLRLGGVDGFVGDGRLDHVGAEGVAELFYSFNLLKAIWLTADYQLLWNPGFNNDRAGPISIPGVRVHAEF